MAPAKALSSTNHIQLQSPISKCAMLTCKPILSRILYICVIGAFPVQATTDAYAKATDAASASTATASSISASDTVSGGTSRTTSPLPAVMAIRPLSIASLHTGPAGCDFAVHTRLRMNITKSVHHANWLPSCALALSSKPCNQSSDVVRRAPSPGMHN